MTGPEIDVIARHLEISSREFGRRYLRRVGGALSLIEKPNHDCIFWDGGCTVYPVRAKQCRTFPFWPENLETPGAWEAVVRQCPGAGEGRRFDLVEIRRLSRGGGATPNGPEQGSPGAHCACGSNGDPSAKP
jgi:Fe-S-cluster containining protein